MVLLRHLFIPSATEIFHSDASNTNMQRRDSTPRSPDSSPGSPASIGSCGTRRPKLLRACVTEPSLAAPNVTPRPTVLSGANSSRKATELLSRVAVFSSNGDHVPGSPRRRAAHLDGHRIESSHDDEESISLCSTLDSGNYFSFPSFDTWEPEPQEKSGQTAEEQKERPG